MVHGAGAGAANKAQHWFIQLESSVAEPDAHSFDFYSRY